MSETARPRQGGNGATPRADTNTPNLNLVLPEIGASNSTWGNKLNSNFSILDNSVQNSGGTINGALTINGLINVGSTGIQYIGIGGGHSFGFAWAGSFVNTYVDGTYIGNMATTQWVNSAFLPLAGGGISGNLNVSGTCSAGTCTAGTLASSGNANIAGDVFGANLITGGGVFGANLEASVQGWKPGGGLWADSSDERLKRDIHDYHAGLRAVCSLRPVTYRFNGLGGTTDDGRLHAGLIAQEAELVMPELVGVRRAQLRPGDPYDEDILTLDPTPLFYALVNACRELSSAVEKLEKQNVTLLGRIRALENRL